MEEDDRLCRPAKRKRHTDCNSDEDGGCAVSPAEATTSDGSTALALTDTMIALRMMRAQFPTCEKVVLQPFVLRTQLYSSVKDRTQVDRDLEAFKKEKIVRIFKLNTTQDDHAVMFTDDYLSQIEFAKRRIKDRNNESFEVFEWFKTYVLDSKLDVSISHQELCSLLSLGGKVRDHHVTLLFNVGVLTHQLIDSNIYWFAIPSIGPVLKALSQGRKELISLLKRKKVKEMPLAALEKQQLRLSPLDMRFHLRDLIGSGHLRKHQTPIGLFVRISRD